MPLFTKPQLEGAARSAGLARKSIREALIEESYRAFEIGEFDVFLSHRGLDAILVGGLKKEIEALGYSVFVDWVEWTAASRSELSPETAKALREQINMAKCLFFAVSEHSSDSKWTAWELGYAEGAHGKVAIVPVLDQAIRSYSFTGQEYLGLYPYVTKDRVSDSDEYQLRINQSPTNYVSFPDWLSGVAPFEH
jgi:hypothetical protein